MSQRNSQTCCILHVYSDFAKSGINSCLDNATSSVMKPEPFIWYIYHLPDYFDSRYDCDALTPKKHKFRVSVLSSLVKHSETAVNNYKSTSPGNSTNALIIFIPTPLKPLYFWTTLDDITSKIRRYCSS